jgi:hypothetical protein
MKLFGKWNEVVYATKVNSQGYESDPIVLWKKSSIPPNNKWGWSEFTESMNCNNNIV